MRRAVLLGNPGTKRTLFLEQAAAQMGVPLMFVDWQDWKRGLPEQQLFLKIDPPLWESCSLEELEGLTEEYLSCLENFSSLAQEQDLIFLNHPQSIAALLDKRACKAKLLSAGLPVTEPLVRGGVSCAEKLSAERLMEQMREQKVYQVFIKPVRGSGAAGVSAFRWQPERSWMALYTCAFWNPEVGLVNTKRLRRFSEPKEVVSLLNRLLELDCIVERWYGKAEYQDFSYDLRAVVQDGKMDFLLARLSKGPITNLHLNNHALEITALGLSSSVLEQVAELVQKSMECYPGLRSAGIDILLERGSLKPRIIEMNAQGDLIYQDIYQNNVIYRHQAEIMRNWLEQAF